MGVNRFAWWPEILDCRGQNQSGTGGDNQTKQIGEAAGLTILLKRKIGIGNLGNRDDQKPY